MTASFCVMRAIIFLHILHELLVTELNLHFVRYHRRYDFLRGKMAEVEVNHVCIQQVFKYESDLIPCELGKARHPPLPARAPSSKEAQRGDCNCMHALMNFNPLTMMPTN
jgi:hypothetical protein